ncbi:hypothetical protein PLESTM_000439600 [Pleodorina starrii]|nr:hypothetical protein PLESTM_000439600 [Pleodorina starrii]
MIQEGKAVLHALTALFNELAASFDTAAVPDPVLNEQQQQQQQLAASAGTFGAASLPQAPAAALPQEENPLLSTGDGMSVYQRLMPTLRAPSSWSRLLQRSCSRSSNNSSRQSPTAATPPTA